MREIEFRGKHKTGGEWVYGGFYPYKKDGVIVAPAKNGFGESIVATNRVHLKTVGQYTGLKDRNGVKIFEGDIVQKPASKDIVLVRWDNESCGFVYDCTLSKHTPRENIMSLSLFYFSSKDYEIIGNIHDNPELINRE